MRHPPRQQFAACAVLATVLAFWAPAAAAQSLALSNFVVDNQAGALTARFGVAVDDIAAVSDALHGGATLALICRAELSRPSRFWLDTRLAAAKLVSRLRYDPLTREYVLTVPGRAAPLKNVHLSELLDSGWSSLSLAIGSWRKLARGEEYDLDLDIRLRQDIPSWFKRTLLFWTRDAAPELSYRLTFKY